MLQFAACSNDDNDDDDDDDDDDNNNNNVVSLLFLMMMNKIRKTEKRNKDRKLCQKDANEGNYLADLLKTYFVKNLSYGG